MTGKRRERSPILFVVTCTALTLLFAVLGTWGFFYYWSERRIEEKRVYYLRVTDHGDGLRQGIDHVYKRIKNLSKIQFVYPGNMPMISLSPSPRERLHLREISGNTRIVSELSESGRELILQNNDDGTKSLVLENAIKGWTSIKNHGVIDFK